MIDKQGGTLILNELGEILIEGNWTVIYKKKGVKLSKESSYDFEREMRLFIEKEKNKYDNKNEYERQQEEYKYERLLEEYEDDRYDEIYCNSVELMGKFFVEYKNNKVWCIYDYNGKELFYVLELLSSQENIYRVVNIQKIYNYKTEVIKFDNDWSKFEKHSYNEK